MKKILLCILDGMGIREEMIGNAFKNASKPNIDYFLNNYPNSLLKAAEEEVGLPKGQIGNSEVGHSNIGAGRIVYQSLLHINNKIKDKSFFDNDKLNEVIDKCKENNSKIHLMGLASDGGVHSHIDHLFTLLDLLNKKNFKNVYLHLFTDGRDTDPKSGIGFIDKVNNKLKLLEFGTIATISGRYYAMDRDNNFDRIKLAYDAIVSGIGKEYNNYNEVFKDSYSNNITDEFIIPSVLDKNGNIEDNDGIILFNFRKDRIVELFSCLTNEEYNKFDVKRKNISLVSFMNISDTVKGEYAFSLEKLNNTLGEVISNNKLTQLRIAETEKYYHVTYFFDGCKDLELKGCKKIMIPSPKVKTYDLKPEMSALKITSKLLEEINNRKPDFIVMNFANGDMVGHTGDYDAAVKAVEFVDLCLGKIYNEVKDDYTIIITADHGNCEVMINEDGSVNTAHTTSLVPFIITDKNLTLNNGKLGDIAPTILELLNIDKPKEMKGTSLIRK